MRPTLATLMFLLVAGAFSLLAEPAAAFACTPSQRLSVAAVLESERHDPAGFVAIEIVATRPSLPFSDETSLRRVVTSWGNEPREFSVRTGGCGSPGPFAFISADGGLLAISPSDVGDAEIAMIAGEFGPAVDHHPIGASALWLKVGLWLRGLLGPLALFGAAVVLGRRQADRRPLRRGVATTTLAVAIVGAFGLVVGGDVNGIVAVAGFAGLALVALHTARDGWFGPGALLFLALVWMITAGGFTGRNGATAAATLGAAAVVIGAAMLAAYRRGLWVSLAIATVLAGSFAFAASYGAIDTRGGSNGNALLAGLAGTLLAAAVLLALRHRVLQPPTPT